MVHNVAHCKKLEVDLTQENSCTVDSFWSRQWITYFCNGLGLYPLQNMNLVTTKIPFLPKGGGTLISVFMYYRMNSHAWWVNLWAEFQRPATEVTHLGLNYPTVFFQCCSSITRSMTPKTARTCLCHKLVIVLATWVKSKLQGYIMEEGK